MSVIGQLYQLQRVDLEREEKTSHLAEVEASLGETEDLQQARQMVTEMEAKLDGLRKQVRELELEVGGIEDKLKHNQDRLYSGQVRNPKELKSLQEEAAALRRHRSQLEDGELELMIAIEGGEAELAERQARLCQIEDSWRTDQAGMFAERDRLQQRLADLEEQSSGMRGDLGRKDLAFYDDLQGRLGGKGIALLKDGLCQGCWVDVPITVARAVERGQGLNYCPICDRLLYGGG
jgi:predicted  nucleic acid-binding Zn-ribbon protein